MNASQTFHASDDYIQWWYINLPLILVGFYVPGLVLLRGWEFIMRVGMTMSECE